MAYLSDTMRVEMSLPVHMMLCVLMSGANCADPGPKGSFEEWNAFHKRLLDDKFAASHKTFRETKALLVKACDEALEGLYPERKQRSLISRIERVHREAVEPYIKDKSVDPRKIGIMAFYLIQHLVNTGLLIIPEESSFGKALENMLPALSPWEGSTATEIQEYELLNKSARKAANKMLLRLQADGYYRGIPSVDYQENKAA
jgi:hypothetical protein